MSDYSFILKRLGLFLAIYIGLSLLFSVPAVNKAHLSVYHTIGQPLLNFVYKGSFVDMKHYEGEPMNKWDTSFQVYEQAKYPKSIYNAGYRKTVPAGLTMHKGLREMVLLPSLLLISLFLITPISWKRRLLFIFFGILILYLLAGLHISYNIRFTQLGGDYSPKSLWDYLILPFGGNFTDEHFYMISLLLWAVFSFSSGLHKQLLK